MRFGYSDHCLDHDTGPRHPESPDRLRAVREGLKGRHGVRYADADPASRAAIERVHDAAFVADVEAFCDRGGGNWDADTVAVEETYDVARTSAGLAVWAAEQAVEGADGRDTPFSLGRPPGHHATSDEAMGFCFFNNVAIAARALLDDAESGVDRVAILDWDVHHGNGTQEIFAADEAVYYASIHEEGLYPGTGEIEETGEGEAAGTTMNVPLTAGSGDAEYDHVVDAAVAPAFERFGPDLLLVSAGFDAHRHDPISRMRVSTEGYAHLTDRVRTLADDCGAALAFVLEGGYGLDTLAESVAMVHETFDGREPIENGEDPDDDVVELVEEVQAVHDI